MVPRLPGTAGYRDWGWGAGQEEGLEEESGGGTRTKFHLEDELDDLYSLQDGEEEAGGQGLPMWCCRTWTLLNSETAMMQFQRVPPWPWLEEKSPRHSCRRTDTGTSLSIVRLLYRKTVRKRAGRWNGDEVPGRGRRGLAILADGTPARAGGRTSAGRS